MCPNRAPWLVLLVVTGAACASSPKTTDLSPPQSRCLRLAPKSVALVGVIERATFPGPPNYESIASGDAEETYWLLVLGRPACVDSSLAPAGEGEDKARSAVQKLQLVFDDGQAYRKYEDLVGLRVVVTGDLFAAETGHHHTEVLLSVRGLVRAPHE